MFTISYLLFSDVKLNLACIVVQQKQVMLLTEFRSDQVLLKLLSPTATGFPKQAVSLIRKTLHLVL